nr:hypothetical protein CFP56_73768 [Quercus suber]
MLSWRFRPGHVRRVTAQVEGLPPFNWVVRSSTTIKRPSASPSFSSSALAHVHATHEPVIDSMKLSSSGDTAALTLITAHIGSAASWSAQWHGATSTS